MNPEIAVHNVTKLMPTPHSVPVKKSKTNICHKKGSKYYDQTKHFRAYNTIKECIESGGRLPKKR